MVRKQAVKYQERNDDFLLTKKSITKINTTELDNKKSQAYTDKEVR